MKVQLNEAINEKDVENIYKTELYKLLSDCKIFSPYGSDGLLVWKKVRTLLEFKFDVDLKSKREQANIFTQLIYYLKKFELDGKTIPSTLFVGDKNECFALETDKVKNFLNRDINWEIAPSTAHRENEQLIKAIIDDTDICPMIFDIDEKFKLRDIIQKIKDLSEGIVELVPIDKYNIVEAFRYWRTNILKIDNNLNIQEQVSFFIYCLVDRDNTYEHPTKKGVLISTHKHTFKEIKINLDMHYSFFAHFKRDYTPSEVKEITACKDRLVDEILRRKTGEFFTPTLWAVEAHKMIAEHYGTNWINEHVVWDCCSGTNNLTRDFKFKELYCSTLNEEDITTVLKLGYNPEATIFQFDFLNDPLSRLNPNLINKFQNNEQLLFLINPPFATAGEKKTESRDNKKGTAKSKINETMKLHKIGRASEQLYAQFLYRIILIKQSYNLTNVKIAFFSKPTYLTGSSFKNFRRIFFDNFKYDGGMLLRADNFADVKQWWGVSFSLWSSGKETASDFLFNVKEMEKGTQIVNTSNKLFYNANGNSASEWVRKPIKQLLKIDCPQVTSAINIKQKGTGKLVEDGLGYMHNNSNNVMQSDQYVGLYSSGFSDAHGLPISKENLLRVVALFAARKSVKRDWINDKDEFLIPNERSGEYEKWNHSALIYSLFHSSSNQSSLRDIKYKGKTYNINNHFFFLPNTEIKELADQNYFNELYFDCNYFSVHKPYLLEIIDKVDLSSEAKIVLETAKKMVKDSIPFRKEQHQLRPEYHLQAWDAGWYQIRKGILENISDFSTDLKHFKEMYLELELQIREGIYKFRFLK